MTLDIKQIDVFEFDERYYQRGEDFRPSVTYKLSTAGPTEWGLMQWRGDVGNKRADEIMEESGNLGSYVHDCLERMVKGEEIDSNEIREMFRPRQALKVLKVWLIDYKTSKSIHTSHRVQLAAYGYSEKVGNLALLHLGNTTKKGWSFLPLKDPKKHWDEFVAISNVFEVKYPNAKPNQNVFPDKFSII
jgi:hypothetical protein